MINRTGILLWALTLCLPYTVVGQVSNEELRTMRILGDLERESRPFRSNSANGPEVEGDSYLWKNWSPGSLTLYRENKTYEISGLKYDVLNFGLDIYFESDKIKSLDGNLVQSFEYKDSVTQIPHRFVNGKNFTRDGAPVRGFLEVLCWGKVDVYAFTEATLLKPNYNVAIGSGSKNYQIYKKRVLLYSTATELRSLSRKELETLWSERADEMKKFQKINKLNPSRERDLMLMVDYFNTL
ncbi:MAG: hypothetical protein JNN04_10605 [Cyclobacteriaceae bacterium]|nr:hypothetical protein [Cyclobacteriaceae bacterium]